MQNHIGLARVSTELTRPLDPRLNRPPSSETPCSPAEQLFIPNLSSPLCHEEERPETPSTPARSPTDKLDKVKSKTQPKHKMDRQVEFRLSCDLILPTTDHKSTSGLRLPRTAQRTKSPGPILPAELSNKFTAAEVLQSPCSKKEKGSREVRPFMSREARTKSTSKPTVDDNDDDDDHEGERYEDREDGKNPPEKSEKSGSLDDLPPPKGHRCSAKQAKSTSKEGQIESDLEADEIPLVNPLENDTANVNPDEEIVWFDGTVHRRSRFYDEKQSEVADGALERDYISETASCGPRVGRSGDLELLKWAEKPFKLAKDQRDSDGKITDPGRRFTAAPNGDPDTLNAFKERQVRFFTSCFHNKGN